jgi:hypothetical protein
MSRDVIKCSGCSKLSMYDVRSVRAAVAFTWVFMGFTAAYPEKACGNYFLYFEYRRMDNTAFC